MPHSSNELPNDRITIRPPQFSLRTLMIAAAGIGVTFGVLRWFDVPPAVGFFVLGVLVCAALATALLVLSLLQTYRPVDSTSSRKEDLPPDEEDRCPLE